MKRLLALAAVAAVAVGLYATTAPGGQQAVTPGQFAALKKQVTKIRGDLDATIGVLGGCIMGTAVPITRYTGYLYQGSSGQATTTALDITEQGGTPTGYALIVSSDPSCINLINSTSLRKLSSFAPLLHANARTTFAHATQKR